MDPTIMAAGADAASSDYSLWALFMRADWVVKAVMIGLIIASVWSWTIIIDTAIRMRRMGRSAERFEDVFWSGASFDDLYQQIGHKPSHPMEAVFVGAMREWRRSSDDSQGRFLSGIKDRLDRVMNVIVSRELGRMEKDLGFLATVGSTAPFVGLFGTVWGIMNAFQAIAATKDTNLAVVAPGIAEALFATALGLLAAIPAVMAYNRFTNQIGRFANRLDGFADELGAHLSREIDERGGSVYGVRDR